MKAEGCRDLRSISSIYLCVSSGHQTSLQERRGKSPHHPLPKTKLHLLAMGLETYSDQ